MIWQSGAQKNDRIDDRLDALERQVWQFGPMMSELSACLTEQIDMLVQRLDRLEHEIEQRDALEQMERAVKMLRVELSKVALQAESDQLQMQRVVNELVRRLEALGDAAGSRASMGD